MQVRRNYSTDLTEKQWRIVEKLLPKHKKGRKPIDRRQVINALFYLVRTGCPWRHLPRSFPKWKTVDTVFWRWRNAGVWEKIYDALCRFVRKPQGKKPTPSVGILDSQSIETTEVGGKEHGYDAGKKVKSRKHRIMVDTLGFLVLQTKILMVIVVHAANIQDYDGAKLVLDAIGNPFQRLKVVFADSACGKGACPMG